MTQNTEPMESTELEQQQQRLQALVSELLKANQELRFKAASLESEVESLRRNVKSSGQWIGMLV